MSKNKDHYCTWQGAFARKSKIELIILHNYGIMFKSVFINSIGNEFWHSDGSECNGVDNPGN